MFYISRPLFLIKVNFRKSNHQASPMKFSTLLNNNDRCWEWYVAFAALHSTSIGQLICAILCPLNKHCAIGGTFCNFECRCRCMLESSCPNKYESACCILLQSTFSTWNHWKERNRNVTWNSHLSVVVARYLHWKGWIRYWDDSIVTVSCRPSQMCLRLLAIVTSLVV